MVFTKTEIQGFKNILGIKFLKKIQNYIEFHYPLGRTKKGTVPKTSHIKTVLNGLRHQKNIQNSILLLCTQRNLERQKEIDRDQSILNKQKQFLNEYFKKRT